MSISNIAQEVNPYLAMLGSDKMTEIYFKTVSGNTYRIVKNNHSWFLQNTKTNLKYKFITSKLHYSKISLEKPFYYGNGGRTTNVSEIIGICTGRNYFTLNAPISNIKKVFEIAKKF